MAHEETLNFIKASLKELEGPNHQWLNYMDQSGQSFSQDGIFLVLVNACFGDLTFIGHRERIIMCEKVKMLQQRYPKLNIFSLQCGTSAKSLATQARIIQTVMEEYITFPILVSDKNFMKMTNGACCLLFEGSTNHLLHHKPDLELEDFVKGCISADEVGNRLFISDSNHHRIVITDGDGKILDYIGSSPGFEDGEFESAKLLRPAASFYDSDEDCLYFVDSENNAIRRADMERRMLETMFPAPVSRTTGIWSWILDNLGLARNVDVKSEELNLDSFTFPWHLLKLGENDLVIFNRSFEMSWIMNMSTWEIKKVTEGIRNILENYGHMIEEKVNLLVNTYESSLSHRLSNYVSVEGIPYAGLMSSVADFHGSTIFCDAAAHRVLKCIRESRTVLDIQFSDLRVLGLPYWLVCPVETVFNRYLHSPRKEHLRHFSVLPGRCDIRVKVDIPESVDLVASLEEDCIWRQARGSVAELSGSEEVATTTEKVGVAQKWFDELDNLAFSNSGNESGPQVEEQFIGQRSQDMHKMHFDCAVNISPGTGEVIVSAMLYLKLSKPQVSEYQTLEAVRILNLQESDRRKPEEDACISLLSEAGGEDFNNVVFMKPLHLRIRLDCADHPKATTPKETILTDTALDINVSLD